MSDIWEFTGYDHEGHMDLSKCWSYKVNYSVAFGDKERYPMGILINIGGVDFTVDYDILLHNKLKEIFKKS